MAQLRDDLFSNVVSCLCELIRMEMRGAAGEQYHPSRNPDESDDYIKDGLEKAAALRDIRTQFENLMTGVLGVKSPYDPKTGNDAASTTYSYNWPIVAHYSGSAAQEGLYGRMAIKIPETGEIVNYYRRDAAMNAYTDGPTLRAECEKANRPFVMSWTEGGPMSTAYQRLHVQLPDGSFADYVKIFAVAEK